jgi:hypothetical protein
MGKEILSSAQLAGKEGDILGDILEEASSSILGDLAPDAGKAEQDPELDKGPDIMK